MLVFCVFLEFLAKNFQSNIKNFPKFQVFYKKEGFKKGIFNFNDFEHSKICIKCMINLLNLRNIAVFLKNCL